MTTELLLFLSGLVAGAFGGLLGLGGGIVIVPVLTIGFGVPITAAAGVSLVSVIATSAGGAAFNVRNRRADVRIGMMLAAGTVVGAVTGGVVAGILPDRVLAGLFAALLAYTAVTMGRRLLRRGPARDIEAGVVDSSTASGPDSAAYAAHRTAPGIFLSFVAGNVSGLLGVGGGVVIVPMMHLLLGAPLSVATATSNFMIGMTAAAGAYPYLFRGDVDPALAAPMVLGVVLGASLQARVANRIPTTVLRLAFIVVLAYVTYEMALRALGAA
ncbi:MAG TPA: sulfite exporter TauE/SafE family protein [Candidatus Limnocylindria bacterium]|nr:sulfite exporter TauE/SafE family protein [Candidatus Limnocylindria bacterium]